eukprot:UN01607
MSLDLNKAKQFVINEWNATIKESLCDYIRVPNQSPMFDKECLTNGLQEKALAVVEKWIDECGIAGLKKTIINPPGRTPAVFLEIPATGEDSRTILAYSHLDKQPPMYPWSEGLDPYTPVLVEDAVDNRGKPMAKLYGRGGADDGYGIYSTLTAIKAAQDQGLAHARILMLTEFCEESGSFDLNYYLESLKPQIGTPDIVVCLDSGCGDYDRLWFTTSLRGMISATLTVKITEEGVHSGLGSGVIPSTMRIMRNLLDRIEDAKTGELLIPSFYVDIPSEQIEYAKSAVAIIGEEIPKAYKFVEGARPMSDSNYQLYINRAWMPTVSYTGVGGIPELSQAGNVLRPQTGLQLSFRLPPTCNSAKAAEDLKKVLLENPPYGATVKLEIQKAGDGFYAPPLEPYLMESITRASTELWGNKPEFESCGGSIPFLYDVQQAFPGVQFAVAGLLGPQSNAHGPDEFMSIPYFFNLTAALAAIFVDHNAHFSKK